jgi:subtilisin family serine protease
MQRFSFRKITKSLKTTLLRFSIFLLLFGMLNSGGLFSSNPPPTAQAATASGNQIVVQLAPGVNLNLLNMLYGTSLVRTLSLDRTYVLAVPLGRTVTGLLSLLQLSPLVTFAEPNYPLYATEAQQAFIYYDQGSGLQDGDSSPEAINTARTQWAWDRIDLDRSQDLSQGAGVIVASLDTGVNSNHPALKGQLIPGYNALNQTNNVTDDSGHGTFVAGVIAQVAPEAAIMPVKVLNNQGEGTIADAAEGIFWAANHNARIINMSLGLYNRSILLELSVKYAQARGDLIVASAGNSATDQKRYPAAYSGVIGVAATDSQNHKAAFSNYGDNARISAPGVNIYSAYYTGGYAYGDGTSFAAPQVAGLAAQVWSENSGVSAGSVSSRILNNAVSLLTADPTYGARLGMGLINNYKAVVNS